MIYGLIKTSLDAHTLGIANVSELLCECGFAVFIGDASIAEAISTLQNEVSFKTFRQWVVLNRITELCFSYRLDPDSAADAFGRVVSAVHRDPALSPARGGLIRHVYFAGLPEACARVRACHGGLYRTFDGSESPAETLMALGVPEAQIPHVLVKESEYDKARFDFGKNLVNGGLHHEYRGSGIADYPEYGTARDSLLLRIEHSANAKRLPLLRAHIGPFLACREEALALFSDWLRSVRDAGLLDILSIGSSQLSQSHFGEEWDGLTNGGGAPFNSELEMHAIGTIARPMLVRAYSGTKDVANYARMLDRTINNAWHALSFWWFNQLDGRGPLTLREGLVQHCDTVRYIASVNKPFEANVSHHFAFRGADDVTYIVSAVLTAELAKRFGVGVFVLQNMLNTPRRLSGTADLVRARVLLRLVRNLEDSKFRVLYQPRAGLDCFCKDLDMAKAQLAAVTALMMDVEPGRLPEIVHVVSYSEASFLATPSVINDSLRITRTALQRYPQHRNESGMRDFIETPEIREMEIALYEECAQLLESLSKGIPSLHSAEGFYEVFRRGYFPVPHLWEGRQDFPNAVNWRTRLVEGGVAVMDEQGKTMNVRARLARVQQMNGGTVR
jgi:hypothetical protein